MINLNFKFTYAQYPYVIQLNWYCHLH